MSIPPPDEWLYDKPRRRRGCLPVLLVVAGLGGGAWWLAAASPWAEAVQARWAETPVARQVDAVTSHVADSPVGRWWDRLVALGASGDTLARLAPADTRVYAEIAPSWWARLWSRGWKPPTEGESARSFAELRAMLRAQAGAEWEADVAPWIEADVGLLGRASVAGGAVDQWSAWLDSRDDAAARAFLAKLRDRRTALGDGVSTLRHGGTSYDVFTPADGGAYAVGLLSGFVVVATPPSAMPPLIAQVEGGGPSLASDHARYRRLAGAWDRGALGHLFVDLGAEPQRGGAVPPEAIGAEVAAGHDWLTLDVITAFDTRGATEEALERARSFVPVLDMDRFDRLPDTTVLALGATATPETHALLAGPLGLGWAPVGGGLAEGWAFTYLLGALESLQGPFVVGLLASPPGQGGGDPVGMVLSARPENPQALEAELDRAAQAVTRAVDPRRLASPVTGWASALGLDAWLPRAVELKAERHRNREWKVLRAVGQPLAGWTLANGELTLAGGAQAVTKAQADDFVPLSGVPGFRDVEGRLRGDKGFFVYADGANFRHLLAASPWLPAKYAHQATLAPLRALGVAAAPGVDRRGFHRSGLTVLFTP